MNSKAIIKSIENSDESGFAQVLAGDAAPSLGAGSFRGLHVGPMRIHTISCENTEWEACLFDGTTFDGIDFRGAFFNGCTFHECRFANAVLAQASFDGCVWQKSAIADPRDLEAAELTNCQFKDCELTGLHFLDSVLESLTISGGVMRDWNGAAGLKSVVLRNVDADAIDTSEMTLTACTASGCPKIPAGFSAVEGRRRRV